MKPHLLSLLGAFAAGIAITLGAQALFFPNQDTPDTPPPDQAGATANSGANTDSGPIGKAPDIQDDNSILASSPDDKKPAKAKTVWKAKADPKKRQEWQKKWQDQMRARTDEKNRVRLEYLAEELGLTPDQLEKVRAALDASTEERLGAMSGGDFAALAKNLTGGDPLEATVQEVLTPEQQEAFTALKEKERNHKIESRTMQRFASLPETLNLSEDQKDQVYEIIAQEEAERMDNQSPASNMISSVVTTMAGDVLSSSVTLDLTDAVSQAVTTTTTTTAGGTATAQPRNVFAGMQERIQQRNEERIEQLRPVLNERQLEAYQSHLQQNRGIFGGGGGATGGVHIEVSNPSSGSTASPKK